MATSSDLLDQFRLLSANITQRYVALQRGAAQHDAATLEATAILLRELNAALYDAPRYVVYHDGGYTLFRSHGDALRAAHGDITKVRDLVLD